MRSPLIPWYRLFFSKCRFLIPVIFVFFCGCVGPALRKSYSDFSEVYADSVDRQLLLNLARLSKDEPPYFIQLGQINAQYNFSASLGFNPANSRIQNIGGDAAKAVQDTLTFGGSVNAGMVQSPTFQFVPLNGDLFAQAINFPISDRSFYTLFDQGFHADTLVRTMVASVRFLDKDGKISRVLVNHPRNPTYPDFLKFCTDLYQAQLDRALVVVQTNESVGSTSYYPNVKLSEAVSAINSGMVVKNINADTNTYSVATLRKGFSIRPMSPTNITSLVSQSFAQTFKPGNVDFQMRTFIATMYAVAKEQTYFDELANKPSSNIFKKDPTTGVLAAFGTNSFQPILAIRGINEDNKGAKVETLVRLKYHGEDYSIGDVIGPEQAKTQNRSVFSILSYLFAQIAIDPQKLPVQQLIQVR
jgi:hypothetical protein